jgi:hypothetical protein
MAQPIDDVTIEDAATVSSHYQMRRADVHRVSGEVLSEVGRSFGAVANHPLLPARRPPPDPCLRQSGVGAKLTQQDSERPALLAHVVMAIVVTRLHTS